MTASSAIFLPQCCLLFHPLLLKVMEMVSDEFNLNNHCNCLSVCMQINWEKVTYMEKTFGLEPWYSQSKSPGPA